MLIGPLWHQSSTMLFLGFFHMYTSTILKSDEAIIIAALICTLLPTWYALSHDTRSMTHCALGMQLPRLQQLFRWVWSDSSLRLQMHARSGKFPDPMF